MRVQKVCLRISKKVRHELSCQAATTRTSLSSGDFAANFNDRPKSQHLRISHRSQHSRPPSTMSVSTSRALGRYVCQFRSSPCLLRPATASLAQQRTSRRWASTDAAAATNPKIATIVDQISQLTLLETADLVSTLKVSDSHYKRIVDSTTKPNLDMPIGFPTLLVAIQ